MPIAYKKDEKLILTATPPLLQRDLVELVGKLAADPETKDRGDLAIEWRSQANPERAKPEADDREWQQWARHYDTLAWQVASIFTAASAILAGGFINARINRPDPWILATFAVAGIGLVLFQMFIVGAFRTYRYDLYKDEHTRNRESPALTIFRKPTGGPWTIYCCTAAVGTIPWVFALARVIDPRNLQMSAVGSVISAVVFFVLFLIWRWAKPPVLR